VSQHDWKLPLFMSIRNSEQRSKEHTLHCNNRYVLYFAIFQIKLIKPHIWNNKVFMGKENASGAINSPMKTSLILLLTGDSFKTSMLILTPHAWRKAINLIKSHKT
jgi:hypothetical protein